MGNLLTWAGRFAAGHNIAIFLASGSALSLITSVVMLITQHLILATVLFTVAGLLVIVAAWVYIYLPSKGSYFPRYRKLYCFPYRKISWRLDGVNVSEVKDGRTVIGTFTCSFRVNRGRINPKQFILEFDGQTRVTPVMIQIGTAYVSCDQIKHIPKGSWLHCQARILKDIKLPDDGVTNHPSTVEFMSEFGAFDLVFKHDDKIFRRRYNRYELDLMIAGQSAIHHGPVSPVPKLEDNKI